MKSTLVTDGSKSRHDYDDDSKRAKSVLDAPVCPPLHLMSLQHHCPALVATQSLMARDFAVLDDFVDAKSVEELRAEVMQYERDGRMSFGEIGTAPSGGSGAVIKAVRDDVVVWLEGSEPFVQGPMRKHILRMDVFSQKIQILLDAIAPHLSWEGAGRTKIMCSLYAKHNAATGSAGAKYNPHVDNGNKNGRRLTTILYLNPSWRPQDGGRLRVKTARECVDIAPLGGRLVVFWPDERVPHEVMPAACADRYAITIWYLDRNERREAEARAASAAATAAAEAAAAPGAPSSPGAPRSAE